MNKTKTRVYTKVVLDMTNDDLTVIYSESYEHVGDMAMCGSSGSSSSKTQVVISAEEKKIMNSLYENMEYMKTVYRDNQLPYDLMVVEGNKELYPEYFKYAENQIGDAQKDLELNRGIKDEMASKQLSDIQRQDTLAQTEYDNAMKSQGRYDTAEEKLANERLDMLNADVNGVMGKATSDVAQAYGTQRDALSRDQARLGVAPGSGVAAEQTRKSALDFAKTSALARTAARDTEIKRVDDANLDRSKANWSKDISLIQGGRSSVQNSTNYTSMLNGGFGAKSNTLATTPQGTDLATAAGQATGTAASGPQSTVVPGTNGNSTTNSLIGAGAMLGAGYLASLK